MSLFPAYDPSTSKHDGDITKVDKSLDSPEDRSKRGGSDLTWLNNTSYSAKSVESSLSVKSCEKEQRQESNIEYARDHKKVNTKKKKKSNEIEPKCRYKKTSLSSQKSSREPSKSYENEQFYEDRKQEKGNFLVDTLYRPAIPRYNKYSHYFKVYKLIKKKLKKEKKPKRYYLLKPADVLSSSKSTEETHTKEEDLSKITEDFNKKLNENPKDIDTWLDYVRFQNTVLEFEKTYRSSTAGGAKVTAERQLAILERALKSNPASDQLLTMKLQLLEDTAPPDQVAHECSQALVQDPGCVPLWRALVRTCRNNMTRCVAPSVLRVFAKALSRLGQLRVHRPPSTVDRDILGLVLECGLFLQQAGLWEQLMMLLQMYLGLNLTASGQFSLPAHPPEDQLREQEDSVLASGLPLSVLWLRVEKLRTAYHYLPLADCEADPQRVVFSQDLADLLQPVAGSECRLQLVACVFLLLKVPLLPTRHSTLQCLRVLEIPSAVSNMETLLAAVYPIGFSLLSDCRYLLGCMELVAEPQFVREAAGRAEYLGTVASLLQLCAQLLPADDAAVVHVWLLRLYTLLCRLHHLLPQTVPGDVVKQARRHARQLLKQPQYRDNLLLYTEYALAEAAAGELDKACQILETAAALPLPLPSQLEPLTDAHQLLLRRRLAECLLLKDYSANRDSAVKALERVSAGWQQLMEQWNPSASEPLSPSAALSPQSLVEGLCCHALHLCLTQSVWAATAMLQRHIDTLPHDGPILGSAWVEQLYEMSTSLLYLHTVHTRTGYEVLRSTLVKALGTFPNNLMLLNTLACLETGSGGGGSPLWKLVCYFPSSVPLARLVLVFVVRHRIAVAEMSGHYLSNLLRRLTTEEGTAQCPLVWRLHLQLVAARDTGAAVKATFYKALQACPWVKALYLDVVKFLPEELPEVQDLLIEKELRIHTMPEELEILRD